VIPLPGDEERLPPTAASIYSPYDTRRIDAVETITISPKFQVVIPKSIRDLLRLRPGQKVQAIVYDNRIELIPVRRAKELRGFARGIDTQVERERDRT
jgi:AbrB family looped-hinge helix DNA binding protein